MDAPDRAELIAEPASSRLIMAEDDAHVRLLGCIEGAAGLHLATDDLAGHITRLRLWRRAEGRPNPESEAAADQLVDREHRQSRDAGYEATLRTRALRVQSFVEQLSAVARTHAGFGSATHPVYPTETVSALCQWASTHAVVALRMAADLDAMRYLADSFTAAQILYRQHVENGMDEDGEDELRHIGTDNVLGAMMARAARLERQAAWADARIAALTVPSQCDPCDPQARMALLTIVDLALATNAARLACLDRQAALVHLLPPAGSVQ